jgi:hypothetical protein
MTTAMNRLAIGFKMIYCQEHCEFRALLWHQRYDWTSLWKRTYGTVWTGPAARRERPRTMNTFPGHAPVRRGAVDDEAPSISRSPREHRCAEWAASPLRSRDVTVAAVGGRDLGPSVPPPPPVRPARASKSRCQNAINCPDDAAVAPDWADSDTNSSTLPASLRLTTLRRTRDSWRV